MKIITAPNPILLQKSKPVAAKEVEDIEAALMYCLALSKNGIGLSAPQIGISKRMFVLAIPEHKPLPGQEFGEPVGDAWRETIINPEILWRSEESDIFKEECLSLPLLKIPVPRSRQITVKYMNADGEVLKFELTGLHSRAFQHEFDHLEGKLITDYQESS
jgi:peptide deformylase